MAVTINLVRDWEDIQLDIFQKFITARGFKSQALERYLKATRETKEWANSREDAIMTWFNYQRRLIPAKPRKLIQNSSLVCPPEVSQGWAMLQQEVNNGIDLTPRLSRTIENGDCNDGMLYDWGIHHFHLGTTTDPKHPRLIQGTKLVLAALVNTSEFCPIDFISHGQWGNKSILEKAISAFPNKFESFCIKGFTDIAMPFADENTVKMRKYGMNSFFKIGDKIYSPPGMGITTAGTSVAATMTLDLNRKRLQGLENQLCEILNAQHCSDEIGVKLIQTQSYKNALSLIIYNRKNNNEPKVEMGIVRKMRDSLEEWD